MVKFRYRTNVEDVHVIVRVQEISSWCQLCSRWSVDWMNKRDWSNEADTNGWMTDVSLRWYFILVGHRGEGGG